MAKIISMFNHKGGVSKTTTTFHLGWKLSQLDYKVLMVDTDSQCNLTGLALGEEAFEKYYENDITNNIKAAVEPAFEGQPTPIQPIDGVEIKKNLWLVPGHIDITALDISLGMAHNFSTSMTVLANLPGAFDDFISKMIEKYDIDYVLIDLNPSLSEINKNLIMISDYFIVPTAPDFFSQMALGTLANTLPRWKKWADSAVEYFKDSTYPFPNRVPTFIGIVMQNYTIRNGKPSKAFQDKVDNVTEKLTQSLLPALRQVGMFEDSTQNKLLKDNNYCIASIPNFQSLVTKMQESGAPSTPVFAIDESYLGTGTVKDNYINKIVEFETIFTNMAKDVLELTTNDNAD